jgi:hypothetical protein
MRGTLIFPRRHPGIVAAGQRPDRLIAIFAQAARRLNRAGILRAGAQGHDGPVLGPIAHSIAQKVMLGDDGARNGPGFGNHRRSPQVEQQGTRFTIHGRDQFVDRNVGMLLNFLKR